MAADVPDRRSRPVGPLAGSSVGRIPRRLTDRVEDAAAWLLTSTGLLVAVAAVLTGLSVARTGDERARVEARERQPVRVVLLADAVVSPAPDGYSPGVPVEVPARWVLPDGSARLAPVTTARRAPAGTELTRWVDRASRPVPPPLGPGRALLDGALHAAVVAVLGWAGVAAPWYVVRRWAAARNAAGWAREWRRVEPRWSGRPLGE